VPHPPAVRGEVLAEQGNPSGDILAAWLSVKLGIPVRRGISGGPGITDVRFETEVGQISLSRHDGRTAVLSRTGESDRRVALHRRDQAELLAEELRRLDPDEVYAESLSWLFSKARIDEDPGAGVFTLADPARGPVPARPGPPAQAAADRVRPSTDPPPGRGEDALDPELGQTGVDTEEEIAGP
jgi:hypothetical protein